MIKFIQTCMSNKASKPDHFLLPIMPEQKSETTIKHATVKTHQIQELR
jgi:hypothetical protein